MTDPTEAIRKALEALRYRAYSFGFEVGKSGKTLDSLTWSNKADQSADEIEEHFHALIDRLDSAERDAKRFETLIRSTGNEVVVSTKGRILQINLNVEGCEKHGTDGAFDFPSTIRATLDDEQRIQDSWRDAALRSVGGKEPK